MFWLSTHKQTWRKGILLLMLLSILGPWIYDAINVPSEYPCAEGYFRVREDFCGSSLSGVWLFFMMFLNIFSVTYRFFIGEAGGREFFSSIGIVLYILLPAVSLLLLVVKADASARREKVHIGILIYASLLSVLWASIGLLDRNFILELWGAWAYTLLIVISLLLELLNWVMTRRALRV